MWSKNKKILNLLIGYVIFSSCANGNYSISGTVQKIERGKDGYNATIITEQGDSIDVTVSRTDMGIRYEELNIGEKVKVYGDSMHLGNQISITATKIVN